MSERDTSLKFAYILACVDPKIRDPLAQIFNKHFGKDGYFMPTELGGVKNLLSPEKPSDTDYLLRKMKMAAEVHPFSVVVLVNHSQCGAYRLAGKVFDNPKEEEKFHRRELQKAEEIIQKYFFHIAVERHYFLKEEQRMAW